MLLSPNDPAPSIADATPAEPAASLVERLRIALGTPARRRVAGIAAAILLELLLLVLLLTIGRGIGGDRAAPGPALTTFSASSQPADEPAAQPEQQQDNQPAAATPAETAPPVPQPETPPPVIRPPLVRPTINSPPQPSPAPTPAIIPVPRDQMAETDVARRPARPAAGPPAGPMMGPPAPSGGGGGMSGDSQRVGTAPDGQPLYAARWYREPTDDEMSGYLSTAGGPGWGLIMCRTAPDYRVEGCVAVEESPVGVRINRAALAAAWQFRVRPPRQNGRDLVGGWVRIRIEYNVRQASANRR